MTQCEVARRLLGKDCCQDPGSCDSPQRLEAALEAIGTKVQIHPGRLDFKHVKSEIDAGRPVCVRIGLVRRRRALRSPVRLSGVEARRPPGAGVGSALPGFHRRLRRIRVGLSERRSLDRYNPFAGLGEELEMQLVRPIPPHAVQHAASEGVKRFMSPGDRRLAALSESSEGEWWRERVFLLGIKPVIGGIPLEKAAVPSDGDSW